MGNPEIAAGIVGKTSEATSGLVVTDSKPFQGVGMYKAGKKYTIADVFAENGCPLVLGNCARVIGWAQVRDRLIGQRIGLENVPMLYLCQCCTYTREYLPAIGHHPTKAEDAEEDGEATHSADCVRLACTTRPIVKDAQKDPSSKFIAKAQLTPSAIIKQIERANGRRRQIRG